MKKVEFEVTDAGRFYDAIDTICSMCTSQASCDSCAIAEIRRSATISEESEIA